MEAAAASRVGAKMLGEIEETSLDELLSNLRAIFAASSTADHAGPEAGDASRIHYGANIPHFPLPALDDLVGRHFRSSGAAALTISGQHLPLLYFLVATLLAPPHHKAVAIVDVDGRFDVTRLFECTLPSVTHSTASRVLRPADLAHVHIARPARGGPAHITDAVAAARRHVLYGAHSSRAREWWGTIVVGGGADPGAGVDVAAGWSGWLHVARDTVRGFAVGSSVEEALVDRARRQEAVDAAGWTASSAWGGFDFSRLPREGDESPEGH